MTAENVSQAQNMGDSIDERLIQQSNEGGQNRGVHVYE